LALTLINAGQALTGRRVLVTGGGFIGGRLAEVLALRHGAEVSVMVHRPAGATRLAHLPCRAVVGDVTDRSAVQAAVAGCDTVFHCAFGTSGSQRHRRLVNTEGTREVLTAAGAAGVRRVVHLSTFMVYGRTIDGEYTEESPRRRFGDAYSDSKLQAEQLAVDLAGSGRSPAVVLQPTNVYGPHGGVWVNQVLAAMRTGRLVLVDDGAGTCNHVYVDDVVAAMTLAATAEDDVVGQAFIVSSGERTTWREFYHHFERMIGDRRTVGMSAAHALELWERTQKAQPRLHRELARVVRTGRLRPRELLRTAEVRAARRLASETLPEPLQNWVKHNIPVRLKVTTGSVTPPVNDPAITHPRTPEEIDFFASRAFFSIDKARRLLGYRPSFDLDAGMSLTAAWARQEALIP
jgi:nucleoside-diphosphate-sugar epimerase